MDERVQISIKLDYYGELLTDKQLNIMNLYYNDDLSLSEISELTNTTRQAIYDILKRCQKLLNEYDSKLKLVEKNSKLHNQRESALDSLIKLKSNIKDENNLDLINNIIDTISNFI